MSAEYDPIINYCLVSKKEKWSFTPIWKNGTKTIFEAFGKHFGLQKTSDHYIHSFEWEILKTEFADDICLMKKNSEEYKEFSESSFNFVVVRDPLERMLSNIYHKIILSPGGLEAKDFFQKYNIDNASVTTKIVSFIGYLELNYPNVDPHFLSQSKIANLGNTKYDMIIELNNIQKGWGQLSGKYNNIPNIANNKNNISRHYEAALAELQDDQILNKVMLKAQKIYYDDYAFISKQY